MERAKETFVFLGQVFVRRIALVAWLAFLTLYLSQNNVPYVEKATNLFFKLFSVFKPLLVLAVKIPYESRQREKPVRICQHQQGDCGEQECWRIDGHIHLGMG